MGKSEERAREKGERDVIEVRGSVNRNVDLVETSI